MFWRRKSTDHAVAPEPLQLEAEDLLALPAEPLPGEHASAAETGSTAEAEPQRQPAEPVDVDSGGSGRPTAERASMQPLLRAELQQLSDDLAEELLADIRPQLEEMVRAAVRQRLEQHFQKLESEDPTA